MWFMAVSQYIYVAIDQGFQRLDLPALKQGLYKDSSEVLRVLGVAMPFFYYRATVLNNMRQLWSTCGLYCTC